MEKIFSKKRIKLPKIKKFIYRENTEKRTKVFIIIIITFMSAITIISRLNPVFNAICSDKAKAIATNIINQKSNEVFKNIYYEKLVDVVKDDAR